MISVEYCRTMARYNAWQNKGMARCLEALSPDELGRDRGAFFGSILSTCNHLLWGDQLWMSRFDGTCAPMGGIPESVALHEELQPYLDERLRTDGHIHRWAERLNQIDLVGPLTWFSGALNKSVTKPVSECVVHFFNHQTHHRGQIHAMLTAAGQRPDDTDLFIMPQEI
ncbi:MAG: damage-inducible protein DinB [Litoreibacter sp.]|nr:damage-inducible protein DinB [Litoreibacter sp.]